MPSVATSSSFSALQSTRTKTLPALHLCWSLQTSRSSRSARSASTGLLPAARLPKAPAHHQDLCRRLAKPLLSTECAPPSLFPVPESTPTRKKKKYLLLMFEFYSALKVAETPEAPRPFSTPGGRSNLTPLSDPPPYTYDDAADAAADAADEKSGQPNSVIAQAAAAVSETAQLTYEELKAKLAQAEAQLLNLKDGGLRQRNVKSSSGDEKRPAGGDAPQAVKQQPEGVAVPIVALLCLLSFLLAYFFF